VLSTVKNVRSEDVRGNVWRAAVTHKMRTNTELIIFKLIREKENLLNTDEAFVTINSA